MNKCVRDNCNRPVRAKGYCINHYSTWYQQEKRAAGIKDSRFSDSDWTAETYEDYWQFVKRELKIK